MPNANNFAGGRRKVRVKIRLNTAGFPGQFCGLSLNNIQSNLTISTTEGKQKLVRYSYGL